MTSIQTSQGIAGESGDNDRQGGKARAWQRYLDAELGFRDHWYPAFFGDELAEADISDRQGSAVSNVRTEVVLGERIAFRRVRGTVLAVEDRCLHRGVSLASRPECYTPDTLTCWYHGFTYDLKDGALTSVITDPGCSLIGKVGIKSYPTEERAGIVWVYVGDGDPPPLQRDVQPSLLDDDFVVMPRGWSRIVACNWRVAAENGFDPAHAYIHRNSPLVVKYKVPTVLGDTEITRSHGMAVVASEEGPVGIRLLRGGGTPVWEADVAEGVRVGARFRPGEPGVLEGMVPDVSVWLPSGLMVDPFPAPGVIHFEWYVPIDQHRHRYMITWGKHVSSEEEREEFLAQAEATWREEVPANFNHDDVFAREAMSEFYDHGDGWDRERLFGPDVVITNWRRLASERGGPVQAPSRAWARDQQPSSGT